jgi:hypothetical protein
MIKAGGAKRTHWKLRGEWVELLFMAEAAKHGLRVIRPWGDSSAYDFVVETGGRFLRVQVKSTSHQHSNAYVCNLVRFGQKRYTKEDIDFFAIYVIPVDTWYIVPIQIACQTTGSISLSPHNSLSRHSRYHRAWHLVGGE